MQVLVTGGAGFIGSALARALIANGHEVRVLDDLSNGSREAVPPEADFLEGDIRDSGDVEAALQGAEVVFHQAALKSVPHSLDEPELVERINSAGTLNVLLAAEKAGVRRLVYSSSYSV